MLKDVKNRLMVGRAYKALFLDAFGKFKPEAVTVLSDLIRAARFFDAKAVEPQDLSVVEGGRQIVRRILHKTKNGEAELIRQIKLNGEQYE